MQPFVTLPSPRTIDRADLPDDLVRFYSQHEGVGLESKADRTIRLCMLSEVRQIGWRDVHVLGQEDFEPWNSFHGIRIGVSMYFDEILYVLNAPCCGRGTILTIGPDISGPGGVGAEIDLLEPSLVLAESFDAWLQRLEECNWEEYGIRPGALTELPSSERRTNWQHYKRLNPDITWELND